MSIGCAAEVPIYVILPHSFPDLKQHRRFTSSPALCNVRRRGRLHHLRLPTTSSFGVSQALPHRRGGHSPAETLAMSTVEAEQIQMLKVHKEDAYDGVIVHMDEPMDPEDFAVALRASVSIWRQKGKKGVWIKLPKNLSSLVDPAIKEGFWYHHAEPDYVMLVYWIPTDIPCTLPINASHRVGVGAFVMNSKKEVLVVQEKSGRFRGTGVWKFPTGVVNEGEDICTAVIREVREETGVETEFVEIVAFRQSHKSFFSKSDLLFICMLQPKSSHIEKQLVEIEAVQWMPIDAYAEQDFVKNTQQFDILAKVCVQRSNQQIEGFAPKTATSSSGKKVYVYCPK